jgi:uncharacterized protein YbjT (DUF2867 family)
MILITGATGSVGREVVELLAAESRSVLAVTRTPAKADFPKGVRVVGANPSEPRTLTESLDGVDAILVSPRVVGGAASELLSLAARHGVKRVVVISALTVEFGGGHQRFADAFRAVEDAAKDSGMAWTLLRCADFAGNALAWAPQIRSRGVVRGAYGDARTSSIHERDVAAVAATTIVDPGHAGRVYVLTGPQSLSQRDKVRLIGQALGKRVVWEEIPPADVRAAMIAQGLPEEVPDRMLGYLADRAREPGPTSTVVEQLLGRPARTFAEWAMGHAAAFKE